MERRRSVLTFGPHKSHCPEEPVSPCYVTQLKETHCALPLQSPLCVCVCLRKEDKLCITTLTEGIWS